MNREDMTLWGIVVAGCIGIGPVLKKVAEHFLSNKVKHTQELDSIRVLEEKNKLKERDETLDFLKTYLEKKDKEFDTLKEILSEIKGIVQENQFTDKKDFQNFLFDKIELLFLKFESNMFAIIDRNHITSARIDITYRKVVNLVERELNEIYMQITEIHYHSSVQKQVNDAIISQKECIVDLYKEVITDYAESELEKNEKKDSAIKQLKECTNYLTNKLTTQIQKITN